MRFIVHISGSWYEWMNKFNVTRKRYQTLDIVSSTQWSENFVNKYKHFNHLSVSAPHRDNSFLKIDFVWQNYSCCKAKIYKWIHCPCSTTRVASHCSLRSVVFISDQMMPNCSPVSFLPQRNLTTTKLSSISRTTNDDYAAKSQSALSYNIYTYNRMQSASYIQVYKQQLYIDIK